MKEYIKVGIGIMILQDNKILLGHRTKNSKDTGGIHEPDSWCLPGGKQEYQETIFEGAIREIKEETNLDITGLKVFGATDDIQKDKHFVTIWIIAHGCAGHLQVMEPDKQDEWKWFSIQDLPKHIYSPSKKFIDAYVYSIKSRETI